MDFHGKKISLWVREIELLDAPESKLECKDRGFISKSQTSIIVDADINCKVLAFTPSKKQHHKTILSPSFKFEDMGIGGLDAEFSAIFRKAFVSRTYDPEVFKKFGTPHMKGILLYGPPGTGKTLIARQIGKMLHGKEPKVVNGPEVLSKFVGQSEENIRKLFADAEKDQKELGDYSPLHVIIFDEIDAICKQRGSTGDSTGVHDTVVNQLLSKLDGVDSLNNILVIGMTNRKDMIDEALLRPGRFEFHLEVGLPDEKGRQDIFNIHTKKMKENKILGDDVDTAELASLTKNFSGAEIAGLVRSATSFALNSHVDVISADSVKPMDVENIKVTRIHFMRALEEVTPAFGVQEDVLKNYVRHGIISYSPDFTKCYDIGMRMVKQVQSSEKTPLISMLFEGTSGNGITALAAHIGMASNFPFVKMISPEDMIGFSESAKCQKIAKVFSDAYKSPLSLVILDNIERLLEYVRLGPRFSNPVLQTLLVLVKRIPPNEVISRPLLEIDMFLAQ